MTTITTQSTSTIAAPTSSSTSSGGGGGHSSNTGPIVGGVVGGIGGLALLALLIWFLRRRAKRDEFDGDFDPDRVVRHSSGQGLDLAGPETNVTPFQLGQPGFGTGGPPSVATSAGAAGFGAGPGHGGAPMSMPLPQHEMAQHGGPAYLGAAGAGGQSAYDQYAYGGANANGPLTPTSGSSSSGYGPPVSAAHGYAGAAYAPSVAPTATSGSHYSQSQSGVTPSSGRSAKEREALAARNGRAGQLHLANHPEGEEAAPVESEVVQHRDGGRVPPPRADSGSSPAEIPPSYDSIPREDR